MDSGRMCMTEALKDDCLCLIFEKLDSKTDRDCFGLTCHRFLDIQNSSRKYLKVKPSCSSSMVDKLLNRFTQLQSLSVTHCSDLALNKLQSYGFLFINSLDLSYCGKNVNDKSIASVASGCPSLSIIRLCKSSSVTDYGLQTLTTLCRSLKRVDISWCDNITDLGITHLIRNCRQLTALTITGCDGIAGVSFHEFPPSLRSLEAGHCHLNSTCVSRVLNMGALEYLDISEPIYPRHSLDTVTFGANLKVLDFKLCDYINDEDVLNISKGCPLLQEWNLSFCHRVMFPGWKSIASHCQNLETLHVNGCLPLRDKALLTLGNGCSRLSLIDISDCYSLTDQAVQAFKTRRPDVVVKNQNKFSFRWGLD